MFFARHYLDDLVEICLGVAFPGFNLALYNLIIRRLRLSLNMPFAEVDDPKGLCKDVSGLGRWGNGDVEVSFSKLDELPYVIGLVRQSLERQLGEAPDV